MIELKIYVPLPGTWLRQKIISGSGIVGTVESGSGQIRVSYEGAIHGQYMTWEDKVFHAAARLVKEYPTVATDWTSLENLIEVGIFRCDDDWKNGTYEITNAEALEAWKAGK